MTTASACEGNQYESPDAAATANIGDPSINGWEFWRATTKHGTATLASIEGVASNSKGDGV
jgi:hypothetical protein